MIQKAPHNTTTQKAHKPYPQASGTVASGNLARGGFSSADSNRGFATGQINGGFGFSRSGGSGFSGSGGYSRGGF